MAAGAPRNATRGRLDIRIGLDVPEAFARNPRAALAMRRASCHVDHIGEGLLRLGVCGGRAYLGACNWGVGCRYVLMITPH